MIDMVKHKLSTGNLILVLAGLMVGALIFEIGLRLFDISYPSFVMADEYRGLAFRPGAEGWYREEGEAYISINSEGLRDREHTKSKPPDTVRIAVLGDSMAAAKQVSMEQTFWSVMERELGRCKGLEGSNPEVINFGIGGYSTAQELITLRHFVWEYSPDIVVLAFTTSNDVTGNSRALNQSGYVPYFIYRDRELVLEDSYLESDEYRLRKSWIPRLLDYSRVLQVLNEGRYDVRTRLRQWRAGKELEVATGNPYAEELGIKPSIYREPEHPVWNEAWRVTEGLILLMRDEVKEKDAAFLVVTLSSGIQVHPDVSVWEEFMQRLGIEDLFYPNQRIQALGDREGFPVLTLAPVLRAYAEEHQVFLHGFENTVLGRGHWNEDGHRLAGQMIAQQICEQLLNHR